MKKKPWMIKTEKMFSKISAVLLLVTSWAFLAYFITKELLPFHLGKWIIAILFVSVATWASIRKPYFA